ncbi:hypothetical protein [Natronococcus wangiae]|uniref:hypothetical protein n=1 Tax=Natronococcus wangiae TaxID=3068275 RepID=UPI00387ED032
MRKGLRVLVAGLVRLPADIWRLMVVGGPVDRRYAVEIRRLINRLELEESVAVTGRLSDEELADRLRCQMPPRSWLRLPAQPLLPNDQWRGFHGTGRA